MGKAAIRVDKPEISAMLKDSLALVSLLCRVREIEIFPTSAPRPAGCLSSVFGEGEISLYVGDVLDIQAEVARLKQELVSIEKAAAASQSRLDKPDFVARAPQEVVEKERSRVAEGQAQIARLRENLASLSQ
jgi:valyl-tRNA synthetase